MCFNFLKSSTFKDRKAISDLLKSKYRLILKQKSKINKIFRKSALEAGKTIIYTFTDFGMFILIYFERQ